MAMVESTQPTRYLEMLVARGIPRSAASPMTESGKVDSLFNRSLRMAKEVVSGRYGKAPAVDAVLTAQANRPVLETGGM